MNQDVDTKSQDKDAINQEEDTEVQEADLDAGYVQRWREAWVEAHRLIVGPGAKYSQPEI